MALPADYPEAAKARTEAGAEAFVRYFSDKVNQAWMTPRTGLIAPLAGPGCKSCAAYEKIAQELSDAKQRHESTPTAVGLVYAFGDSSPEDALFNVVSESHQLPAKRVDASGGVMDQDDDKEFKEVYSLAYEDGVWQVNEVRNLK